MKHPHAKTQRSLLYLPKAEFLKSCFSKPEKYLWRPLKERSGKARAPDIFRLSLSSNRLNLGFFFPEQKASLAARGSARGSVRPGRGAGPITGGRAAAGWGGPVF